MKRDLLRINDLSPSDLTAVLDAALRLKRHPRAAGRPFRGLAAAMVFEKPSLRTRMSFELALQQLGATPVALGRAEVGIGDRETAEDAARALAAYAGIVIARVFSHDVLERMAAAISVPVINALSDIEHPCQALADLLTMHERFGTLRGRTLAFIGDGNNVAHSLLAACARVGMNVCLASPPGYELRGPALAEADEIGRERGAWVEVCHAPRDAVRDADVIYTDGWYSMGQEDEAEHRRSVFRDFQVNAALLSAAPSPAVAMHCLPAHRGEEITDEVLDSAQCLAFQQAENRLHAQKAVLLWALRPDVFARLRS